MRTEIYINGFYLFIFVIGIIVFDQWFYCWLPDYFDRTRVGKFIAKHQGTKNGTIFASIFLVLIGVYPTWNLVYGMFTSNFHCLLGEGKCTVDAVGVICEVAGLYGVYALFFKKPFRKS